MHVLVGGIVICVMVSVTVVITFMPLSTFSMGRAVMSFVTVSIVRLRR
jgi:hypothetical protein